ncbi:hypothetical protein KIW84_021629 [Lathyrus oleraceus]|uniref:Uncharacterized protein n=1 Tax=Pisum sativum TaxID=3888 RepID=A0A9D4YC72_PEA|nr:hypothetical protein KIW84_021629 [Pisum sativum]
MPKKKIGDDDGEYYSGELDNSDPDESDDEGPSLIGLEKSNSDKAVMKIMQTSETVRIHDIMQDMRQNFSVGISVARAWKEKLIAKKINEGDAYKKYANL